MKIADIFVCNSTASNVRQLCSKKDADRAIANLAKKRAATVVLIFFISAAISVPVFIYDHEAMSEPLSGLEREEYKKGDRIVELRAVTDDGHEEMLSVNVSERRFSESELEEYSKKIDAVLWSQILKDNTDLENVMYDLDLKKSIENYPFDITWKTDKPLIIGADGTLNTERLAVEDPDNDGIYVRLCATLKYRDFSEDKYGYACIKQKSGSCDGTIGDVIEKSIKQSDQRTQNDKIQELPDRAGDLGIRFYRRRMNKGWVVLFFGAVFVVIPISASDGRIGDEAKKRRKQIEADYTKILNQYVLYYMAGMNPRAIWTAMCDRYESERKIDGKGKRYVYEEMIMTRNRMDEGTGELAAYDEFAVRCDNVRFRTFISFVKQAVVKGNEGLDRLLYDEMEKARRENINRVKAEASEASTKLLLPMFMMLIIVLVIVMIPAFMEMNG